MLHKIIIIILTLALARPSANAGSIILLKTNTTNISSVCATFVTVDNANQPNTAETAEQIKLTNNGITLPATSYQLATNTNQAAAVALVFDLTIANRTSNPNDFILAKDILTKTISYLNPNTNTCLLTAANIACVEADFTTQHNTLANATAALTQPNESQTGLVNLYKALADGHTAAITMLQNQNINPKAIILVTQGIINTAEAELLIDKAKQNNTKIHIIYINEHVPANISRIADSTGGFVITKTMLTNNYLPALATIAKIAGGHSPYTFTWQGQLNCSGVHNFELNTTAFGTASFGTTLKDKQLTSLIPNTNGLEFPSVTPGTSSTKTATIAATNGNIHIEQATTSNPLFKITATKPPLPATIAKGDSLTLTLAFTPADSAIAFGYVDIISNACNYDTLLLTGGYPNVAPTTPTIKITTPTCNQTLVIGDTIEIKYHGVLANDVVSINTQNKAGQLDTFARNIVGLTQQFYINPSLPNDSIRFVINQMWPNNVGKTLTFPHSAPVTSAFFNQLEDKIVTACADSTVAVFNAHTGALLQRLAPFQMPVRWAKFFKDPSLADTEYIAVACADSCAYLFRTSDYSLVWRHKTSSDNVVSIEASPDGRYAAVAVGNTLDNGHFDILEMPSGQLLERVYIPAEYCRYATFHPTKKYEIMAISSWTGVLYFYSITPNNRGTVDVSYSDSIDAKNGLYTLNSNYATYNHNGSQALLINYQQEAVDIIDITSHKTIRSIQHSNTPRQKTPRFASFFYLNDGTTEQNYILTTGNDNILRRFDATTGQPSAPPNIFAEHTQPINTGVFSKDGWRLLSCSDDSTAKIWNLNQKVLQTDTTCWLEVAAARGQVPDSAAFSATEVGRSSIKTIHNYFTNLCAFNYNIKTIRIVGQHTADFAIADEPPLPMPVSGLSTLNISIVFRPQAAGWRHAQLQVIIPNDTIYIELTGIGIVAGLRPLCELVDFGQLATNDYHDTTIALAINQSGQALELSALTLAGPQAGNFKLDATTAGNRLQPNDTLFATIRFFVLTQGRKHASLNIAYGDDKSLIKWNLTGLAEPPTEDTITLSLDSWAAATGEQVPVPLRLTSPTSPKAVGISQLRLWLEFNATLLAAKADGPDVRIISQAVAGQTASVELSISYKPGQQVIDGLSFLTLLGNDTGTAIKLLDPSVLPSARVKVLVSDAAFTLSEYCQAGGVRLFDASGKLVLWPVVPNPASGVVAVSYDLLESGLAALEIYSISGQLIGTVFRGHRAKGSYTIELPLLALPFGQYFLVLHSGSSRVQQLLMVGG